MTTARLPINQRLEPMLPALASKAGSEQALMSELSAAYHAPANRRRPEPSARDRGVIRGPNRQREAQKERRVAESGWFVVVELERNTIVFADKQHVRGEGGE